MIYLQFVLFNQMTCQIISAQHQKRKDKTSEQKSNLIKFFGQRQSYKLKEISF